MSEPADPHASTTSSGLIPTSLSRSSVRDAENAMLERNESRHLWNRTRRSSRYIQPKASRRPRTPRRRDTNRRLPHFCLRTAPRIDPKARDLDQVRATGELAQGCRHPAPGCSNGEDDVCDTASSSQRFLNFPTRALCDPDTTKGNHLLSYISTISALSPGRTPTEVHGAL